MAIVKQLDKRSGITYVYESASYWDKEKQQPAVFSEKKSQIDLRQVLTIFVLAVSDLIHCF